jgi:hypothetical protein
MANPASMKTDQAYNGLHPVADVHDHLRNWHSLIWVAYTFGITLDLHKPSYMLQ